jgi:hypothetical protein
MAVVEAQMRGLFLSVYQIVHIFLKMLQQFYYISNYTMVIFVIVFVQGFGVSNTDPANQHENYRNIEIRDENSYFRLL